jgi:hypothetical protein
MAGEAGGSSQRERVLGLSQRGGQGIRKQGNIVQHTDGKLGAEMLDWSGRQGRTNAVPRSVIESHR